MSNDPIPTGIAKAAEGPNMAFIADCLRNYAGVLENGVIDGAGHYFPSDIYDAARQIEETATPAPLPLLVGTECQYAKDQGTPEHRCAVRCIYEEKGFAAGIEQAARVAERYDETDTLSAPKAIASAIRALTTEVQP